MGWTSALETQIPADYTLYVVQHICSVHALCAPSQLLSNGSKVSEREAEP